MQPTRPLLCYGRGETNYQNASIDVLSDDLKKGPFIFLSLLPSELDGKDLSEIKNKKAHYADRKNFPFSMILATGSTSGKNYVYFSPCKAPDSAAIKTDQKIYIVSWETFQKYQYPLNSQEHLNVWNEDFNEVILNCDGDMQQLKQPRQVLFEATKSAIKNGFYVDGTHHQLDSLEKMVQGQQCFAYENMQQIESLTQGLDNPHHETVIEFFDESILGVAEKHVKDGFNPLVQNLANDKHPGGGVAIGAGALEESIFRQTSISHALRRRHLPQNFYPIDGLKAIYTPFVQIFRQPERDLAKADQLTSYAYQKPVQVAIATCAAVHLKKGGTAPANFEELTYGKLKLIISIAIHLKHDSLVLGAFGCGAYNNPPEKIAFWTRHILESLNCRGRFRKISFAICYNKELLRIFESTFANFGCEGRLGDKNTSINKIMLDPTKNKDDTKNELQKFRQDIFKETKRAAKEGYVAGGILMKLGSPEKMIQDQKCFTHNDFKDSKLPHIKCKTEFEVVAEDILVAAERYLKAGLNLAVVNTANPQEPGKGTENGYGQQENAFFYRTNIFEALNLEKLPKGTYPIKDPKALYTCAQYFRGPERDLTKAEHSSYAYQKPVEMPVITCAPIRLRKDAPVPSYFLSVTRQKIELIVAVAVQKGHDVLVINAWGCGGYNNDPKVIADLIKEAAQGKLQKVIIAIPKEEKLASIFKAELSNK